MQRWQRTLVGLIIDDPETVSAVLIEDYRPSGISTRGPER